jgi:hypothetical protein
MIPGSGGTDRKRFPEEDNDGAAGYGLRVEWEHETVTKTESLVPYTDA